MSELDEAALRDILKEKARLCGSQQELARALGFSGAFLSDVLNARRAPTDGLAEALGYERVIRFRKLR